MLTMTNLIALPCCTLSEWEGEIFWRERWDTGKLGTGIGPGSWGGWKGGGEGTGGFSVRKDFLEEEIIGQGSDGKGMRVGSKKEAEGRSHVLARKERKEVAI